MPDEPGSAELGREFRYAETSEFVVIEERQNGTGTPRHEVLQVVAQVA